MQNLDLKKGKLITLMLNGDGFEGDQSERGEQNERVMGVEYDQSTLNACMKIE
jgi:hypothetical protein